MTRDRIVTATSADPVWFLVAAVVPRLALLDVHLLSSFSVHLVRFVFYHTVNA
jgi:hypothetical protein